MAGEAHQLHQHILQKNKTKQKNNLKTDQAYAIFVSIEFCECVSQKRAAALLRPVWGPHQTYQRDSEHRGDLAGPEMMS